MKQYAVKRMVGIRLPTMITPIFARALVRSALFAAVIPAILVSRASGDTMDPEKLARECRPAVMLILAGAENSEPNTLGSGFLISSDGLLVTNHHVIAGAGRIVAKSSTGGLFPVKKVLSDDSDHDLAILQLDGKELPCLPLADEKTVNPGAALVVIGNPTGLTGTITQGIVSAVRNHKVMGPVFQISAAISPGSSGSPVLSAEGKVFGIATFKQLDGESLNFAVSVQSLKPLLALAKPGYSAIYSNSESYKPRAAAAAAGLAEEDQKTRQDPAFSTLRKLEKELKFLLMLESAKELAGKYPKSALAQRRLSDAYYYAHFDDEAMSTCKKALDMNSGSGRAWNNIATVYLKFNNETAALSAYREGLKVAPSDAKLWMEYGEMIGQTDKDAGAEAVTTAINLLNAGKGTDEESIVYPLMSDAAGILLRLGRNQEAYDAALIGIRMNADSYEPWLVIANCANELKYFQHVKPYLDRAHHLGAPEDVLYELLADCEQDQRHWDKAADWLQYAHKARASDKSLLLRLINVSLNRDFLNAARWHEISDYINLLSGMDPKLGEEASAKYDKEVRARSANQ